MSASRSVAAVWAAHTEIKNWICIYKNPAAECLEHLYCFKSGFKYYMYEFTLAWYEWTYIGTLWTGLFIYIYVICINLHTVTRADAKFQDDAGPNNMAEGIF